MYLFYNILSLLPIIVSSVLLICVLHNLNIVGDLALESPSGTSEAVQRQAYLRKRLLDCSVTARYPI